MYNYIRKKEVENIKCVSIEEEVAKYYNYNTQMKGLKNKIREEFTCKFNISKCN